MNFFKNQRKQKDVYQLILFTLQIIFVLFFLLILLDLTTKYNLITNFLNLKDENITSFHGATITVLTAILIFGIWHQIRAANEISKNDFLLRIDQHYGSNKIVEAREIIHQLYRQFGDDSVTREHKIIQTSYKIEQMRTSNNPFDMADFIKILCFLDFLETIALFYNKGAIDNNDLELLTGESIQFYHAIFSDFIRIRRINTNQLSYYAELDKLILQLKKEKISKN